MSYLFSTREIGDYRISVFQDEDAGCPCLDCDFAGLYIWGSAHSSAGNISRYCNYKELFGEYDNGCHSMREALQELVCKYVSQRSLIAYIKKGNLGTVTMWYERGFNEWVFNGRDGDGHLQWWATFTPGNMKEEDIRYDITRDMSVDELAQIIRDLAGSIVFYEWHSTGYCQGDYVSGFAWCDKARFAKFVDTDTRKWRERILRLFESETRDIGMFLWGDVKGYVLERKVPYRKIFADADRPSELSCDWEEVDSCWGFYMDTEELIDEVVKEHGLTKNIA